MFHTKFGKARAHKQFHGSLPYVLAYLFYEQGPITLTDS